MGFRGHMLESVWWDLESMFWRVFVGSRGHVLEGFWWDLEGMC